MAAIDSLNIIDWRNKLPRASWSIGTRTKTDAITVHYNGPAVSSPNQYGQGLLNQLIIDANYQMQPGALNAPDGGDGLQYHAVVASDGKIYQTRDWNAFLWHSGDSDGNAHSLSLHLPLGGSQDATTVQWNSMLNLIKALRADWKITNTSRIKGHKEWSQSSTVCPGTLILPRVIAYRNGTVHQGGVTHISKDVAAGNIRQGPGTTFPIAGTMYPGDTVVYDAIIKGQSIGGDDRWLHLSSGLGFLSATLMDTI